jgi:hypothetical protein
MSIGSSECLMGYLNEGQFGLFVLRVDGGGQWRLDADRTAQGFLGKHVKITGRRSDFDVIDVDSIETV